jgi:hypothetical protein
MHVAVAAFLSMLPVAAHGQSSASIDNQMKAMKVHIPPTRWSADDAAVAHQFWQILSKDLSLAAPFEMISSEEGKPPTVESDLVLRTKVHDRLQQSRKQS